MLGSQALQQQRSADMHSLVRAAFILCIRRHDEAEFDNLGKLFGPSWGRGKRCQMSLGSGEGEEEKGGPLDSLHLSGNLLVWCQSWRDGDAGWRLEMIPDPGRTPEGTG